MDFGASAGFRVFSRGVGRLGRHITSFVMDDLNCNTTEVTPRPSVEHSDPSSAHRDPASMPSDMPKLNLDPPKPGKQTGRLMSLPPEIQLMIVRQLTFGDVERLRRTCKFYRSFIAPATVRELFKPYMKMVLLSHCYICLKYDPTKASLLWADFGDPRYPLASKCVDCAVAAGDFMVGKKVSLGNFASVWVCRWCGYPVFADSAWNQPEFHKICYNRYNDILLGYFSLGWIQFAVVVTGGALCWKYFRLNKMVLIPSIVSRGALRRCQNGRIFC